MKIEVEWYVKPKSGVTEIDLDELNCESQEEWDALSQKEQEERLNYYLKENELLIPLAVDWEKSDNQ